MKKQIKRLSPHQNGKVVAVLITISALLMFIPMAVLMYFMLPQVDQQGNPVEYPIFMFAVMPIFYLVFGYIFAALGCAIYNVVYKFIGGFEFEVEEKND